MSSRLMSGINTKTLVQLAVISCLMVIGKEALAFIPNVHPVTLLIILTAVIYGKYSLLAVISFVFIEILIYGFGFWSINYLYVWPIICAFAIFFRDKNSALFWALFASICGFSFGAFCSIPYIFIGGIPAAFSYWIAGIPFDLIHGISNFVLVFLLFTPLRKLLEKLKNATNII